MINFMIKWLFDRFYLNELIRVVNLEIESSPDTHQSVVSFIYPKH